MSVSTSYLTTLFGTGNGTATSDLLAAAYGFAGQTTNSIGQNPVTALSQAEQNQAKDITMTAAEPQVKRAVDAFTAGVTGAKSVQQLLANPDVMKVLLTANGLGDQVDYAALAQKTLTSNALMTSATSPVGVGTK